MYLKATIIKDIKLYQIIAMVQGNAYKEKEINKVNNINNGTQLII